MPVLADVRPRTMLRIVYGFVAVAMAAFALGVVLTNEHTGGWTTAVWATVAVLTCGAALHGVAQPAARVPRMAVGLGVPVLLAWRCYIIVWELVTNTLPVDTGRGIILAAAELIALVFFPLYWARVVIPISEIDRHRRTA